MNFIGIKNVYVDLDGTLLDSYGCWAEGYETLCKKHGVIAAANAQRLFDELAFNDWLTAVLSPTGFGYGELLDCVKLAYAERPPKRAVLSLLESLPADRKAAVVTKEPRELAEFWLFSRGIALFSDIVTADGDRQRPEFYAAKDLLVIDDNYRHCQAAAAAGARVIGVDCRHTAEQARSMRSVCELYIRD